MRHCILAYQNETKELSGRAQDGTQCVCNTRWKGHVCKSFKCLTCIYYLSLIHAQYHSVHTYNNINKHQHGFRPSHSCQSQLLLLTDDILKAMDEKKQVDLILLDFAKPLIKCGY